MTRRLAFLVLATLAVLCLSLVSSTAQAQTEPTKSPIDIREPNPVPPNSIPRPNSGTAPASPGDLGGGLQLTLLGLIAAFPVVAVFGIRRAARAGAKPTTTPTSSKSTSSVV